MVGIRQYLINGIIGVQVSGMGFLRQKNIEKGRLRRLQGLGQFFWRRWDRVEFQRRGVLGIGGKLFRGCFRIREGGEIDRGDGVGRVNRRRKVIRMGRLLEKVNCRVKGLFVSWLEQYFFFQEMFFFSLNVFSENGNIFII